jgi:hypothetical protein
MFNDLETFIFINKLNNEILLETKLNDLQYLTEFVYSGKIKYSVDNYSAFWYPDIYEFVDKI